jgi:hypothetical protein
MALTPQTIPPIESANTYIDVAYFDAYHTARGNDISELTPTQKEQLIIKAMDFIETTFYDAFIGVPSTEEQMTLFPRKIDGVDAIPQRLKDAQAVLALKASVGELLIDKDRVVIKEKLDVLETTYSEYSDQQTKYTFVYSLLRPLLSGTQNSIKIVRV